MRPFIPPSGRSSARRAPASPAPARGFGLVEMMIAALLMAVLTIAVMRVFATSEGSRRAVSTGGDAQINGTIVLYNLERDLRLAGHGFGTFNLLGCSLTYQTSADARSVTLNLGPVTVNPATTLVPAGDSGSDTLLVISSESNAATEGDAITSAAVAGSYQVTTPGSYAVNDLIIPQTIDRPSPCNLTLDKVTAVPDPAVPPPTLTVATGSAGLASGSVLYNLGQAMTVNAYAVRNGNLTVCDYTAYDCSLSTYLGNATVWVPVGSNVVALRAQYGRDTSNITGSAMDGVVDTYDQTTPGSAADTSGLAVQCGWARIIQIRLVLVARNQQYDKAMPTAAAPTWPGSSTHPVDLSGLTNWQYYRYKALDSLVAIKNMIWSGSQATFLGGNGGC